MGAIAGLALEAEASVHQPRSIVLLGYRVQLTGGWSTGRAIREGATSVKDGDRYKNGQIKQEVSDGVRTVYFTDGTVKARGGVADGKMHGEGHFYRKSGELWVHGSLKEDVQDGRWIRYNRDGSVEKEMWFVDGKQTGGGS